jgi:tRNA modification GTPase
VNSSSDTIAAIATAPGAAGVCIIRVSGPRAFDVADLVFRCSGKPPSQRDAGTFVHGNVVQGPEIIDDALLLVMRAPHSYTGEDVVEIQGHGGPVVAKRILRAALDTGARMAEPGEFTKRAFLNGRMDLVQAEAVLDLIQARSDRAASAAAEQLQGSLSKKFNALYDEILGVTANIEATLDFPEDELPPAVMPELTAKLGAAHAGLNELIATWGEGHLLREGALVVISGRPNVGKSTLLNTLLGTDRAIVSPIPGTTRDVLEEGFILDGFLVRLIDTAGLRETDCEIEQEGIRRTHGQIKKADVQLYMIDASAGPNDEDQATMSRLDANASIVVLNKIDAVPQASLAAQGHTVVRTSLKSGAGVDELKRVLIAKLGGGHKNAAEQHAVISERHRKLLLDARAELDIALDLMQSGRDDGVPLASARLRSALELLGLVTGRVYQDELLDSIFSRFCIGK